MDVLFLRRTVFDIPSSHRVGAIVVDGASDLRLWPGPGPDRELRAAYGTELQKMLDRERSQMGVESLGPDQVARIHSGRLHCDFLAWVGTREPEPGAAQSPAPDAERLRLAVLAALNFVAARSVEQVAFPALGEGPSALSPEQRLISIVRACHEFEDLRFKEGKAPVVETALVCHPVTSVLNAAKRSVASLASRAILPEDRSDAPKKVAKRRTAKSRAKKPALDPQAASLARSRAGSYDRTHRYQADEWLKHPKFGVGQVKEATAEGAIVVTFEGGLQKKLIHGR